MSKENIAKFQETIAKKPELLEKLKDARTPEAVVVTAQAEGFDFTAEELAEYGKADAPTGRLNDEALNDVAGGDYDELGLVVTIGYGCSHWEPANHLWLGAKGCCGSCSHYSPRPEGLMMAGHCYR